MKLKLYCNKPDGCNFRNNIRGVTQKGFLCGLIVLGHIRLYQL